MKFSLKSLTFSCVICALNLYFAQTFYSERQNLFEVARTAKSWSNAKNCSKVAEHNRERPSPRRPKGTADTRKIPRSPIPIIRQVKTKPFNSGIKIPFHRYFPTPTRFHFLPLPNIFAPISPSSLFCSTILQKRS